MDYKNAAFSLLNEDVEYEFVPSDKLTEIQNRTYEDMAQKIKDFGIVNVLRPTGFGKTELFMRYIRESVGQRFIFVFDSTANRTRMVDKYPDECNRITFTSYMSLSIKVKREELLEDIKAGYYKAIIFDESHHVGKSNNAGTFMEELHELDIEIIGGSANNVRLDNTIVTDEYFEGTTVFEYTLSDSISDGIIKYAPHCFTTISDDISEDELTKAGNTINVLNKAEVFKDAMGTSIRRTLEIDDDEVEVDLPNYMLVMCFYSTITRANDAEGEWHRQLKEVFPDYYINIKVVTSSPNNSDVDEVLDIERRFVKQIDFIISVDLMNQGFHFDNLTAVLMMRKTVSNIVFTQQIGRAISVRARRVPVIVDYVGNIDYHQYLGETKKPKAPGGHRGPSRGEEREEKKRDFEFLDVSMTPKMRNLAEALQRVEDEERLKDFAVKHNAKLMKKWGASLEEIAIASKVSVDSVELLFS